MATFSAPPGWPTPPPGWTPPASWTPDPRWPPAPPGWEFWVATAAPLPTRADVIEVTATIKARALRSIVFGALWVIAGLVISIATYTAATDQGGTYFVFWGAAFFGGLQLIRGIARYSRARHQAEALVWGAPLRRA